MKKSILLSSVASLLLGTISFGQVTSAGNNSIVPPQFLGFNGVGPVKNLDIRNNFNRPINFFTNNLQRISLTNTGSFALGLNFNNPLSLMHIDGNGYNNGEVFRTDGPAATLNAWRMETGGVPRASFYTQANNNVFTEVRTQGAIYGIRTDNQLGTNGGLRLLIMNDGPLQPKGSFC